MDILRSGLGASLFMKVGGAALSFLLHFFVVREFGQEVYGLLALIMMSSALAGLLSCGGYNYRMIRDFRSHSDQSSFLSSMYSSVIVYSAVTCAIIVVVLFFVGYPHLVPVALCIPMMAMSVMRNAHLRVIDKPLASILPENYVRPVLLFAFFLTLFPEINIAIGYLGAVIGFFLVGQFLVRYYSTLPYSLNVSSFSARPKFEFSLVVLAVYQFVNIQSGLIVSAWTLSLAEIGVFAFLLKYCQVFQLGYSAVLTVQSHKIREYDDRDLRSFLKPGTGLLVLLASVLLLAFVLFSPLVFKLVRIDHPDAFASGVMMLVSLVVVASFGTVSEVVVLKGAGGRFVNTWFVAIAILIVAGTILAGSHGLIGLVLAYCVFLVGYSYALKRLAFSY